MAGKKKKVYPYILTYRKQAQVYFLIFSLKCLKGKNYLYSVFSIRQDFMPCCVEQSVECLTQNARDPGFDTPSGHILSFLLLPI